MIFCIASGKLLRSIYPKLQGDEFVKILKIDENGFVILVTTRDRLFVYSINGEFISSTDKFGKKIKDLKFLDKLKPFLVKEKFFLINRLLHLVMEN